MSGGGNQMSSQIRRENEIRVAEEYYSSLSDLNCNSKPLINMLTMLAEENIEYAPVIVKVVADHITKVPPDIKLPILYLIDSIVKNVKKTYTQLFSQCIVNLFCEVFEKVNEKVRERMYALRQTWNDFFSPQKLYTLDVCVKRLDHNWPITAKQLLPSIHVNPNFLKTVSATQAIPSDMKEIIHVKTRELLEMKKRKLELELEATKKHLEEQEKQLSKTTETVMPADAVHGAILLPAVATINTDETAGGLQARIFNHSPQFRQAKADLSGVPPRAVDGPSVSSAAPQSTGKQKVHPVQPALINTIRQRDPRLARQQQQQQRNGSSRHPTADKQGGEARTGSPSSASSSSSTRTGSGHRGSGSSRSRGSASKVATGEAASTASSSTRSESKSPIRQHSSSPSSRTTATASSHSSSTVRGGKSYSSPSSNSSASHSSNRDRTSSSLSHKERKRGGAAAFSPSRSSNSAPIDRRKHSASSSSSAYDKDAFEIVPLATALGGGHEHQQQQHNHHQHHHTSFAACPASATTTPSSPTVHLASSSTAKNKGNSGKRSTQSSLRGGNNHRYKERRSPSPLSVDNNPNRDVDLRKTQLPPATATVRELLIGTSLDCITADDAKRTEAANSNKTSSSTATISLAFEKTPTREQRQPRPQDCAASVATANDEDVEMKTQQWETPIDQQPLLVDGGGDVDHRKKRTSNTYDDGSEPATKKSKAAAKLDILFGAEDVDLRTLAPQQMLQQQALRNDAPPPPHISEKDKRDHGAAINSVDKSLKPKGGKLPYKKATAAVASNLDDVRAKLAKAAKYSNNNNNSNSSNKTKRVNDKAAHSRELSQRLKLSELQTNDDTQEDNDEKIRTIMAQAQEMLESNSISAEQYKNLVQTVMAINETTKLREAKRRESLTDRDRTMSSSSSRAARNAVTLSPADDDDSDDDETERREAVLKKRIPKLNKSQTAAESFTDAASSTRSDSNDVANNPPKSSKSLGGGGGPKDKSFKIKWNERANTLKGNTHAASALTSALGQHKSWLAAGKQRFAGNQQQQPSQSLSIVGGGQQRNASLAPWNLGGSVPPTVALPIICSSNVPAPPKPPGALNIGVPKPCNSIDNPQADLVRRVPIDGQVKEIRIYDQVAIAFMEMDRPHEIGFMAGKRNIVIDNQDAITLHFNDAYRMYNVAGVSRRLRFGFPSRELYIDDNWYEIYFGGPAVAVPVAGRVHFLRAEGPPPQVDIGPVRLDLVVGKINMIVDALIVVPLFLDAKLQTFRLGEREHSVQFADNLLTVLLDGQPERVEFGGLPRSYTLGGKKYFIRFTTLPQGISAGHVQIRNMLYVKMTPPNPAEQQQMETDTGGNDSRATKQLLPGLMDKERGKNDLRDMASNSGSSSAPAPALPINIDELFQKLVSSGILSGNGNGSASTATPPPNVPDDKEPVKKKQTVAPAVIAQQPEEPETVKEYIAPIELNRSESVKTRQAAIVNRLFSGMQCSSCGLRFSPEQTIKYSQHLDWHFRQNRHERDTSRKAHSRKWYLELADWMQYEEIEDVEEKEKNALEGQQMDLDVNDESSNNRATNSPTTVQSCPAAPDDVDRVCDMCQERFEQFYHEEFEEWHLRTALRIEDKIYHPLCYEDFKAALNVKKQADDKETAEDISHAADDNATDTIIRLDETNSSEHEKPEGADNSAAVDDVDDDDVIVLPNEEPVITEIDDDDEEYTPVAAFSSNERLTDCQGNDDAASSVKASSGNITDTAESDVEIQEPHIPFTDLDTYVEKDLPVAPVAEESCSQPFFGDIKIKEEPKEEEDEDDGFEDVGTVVMLTAEEISLQEESTSQVFEIISSSRTASPTANSGSGGGDDATTETANEPADTPIVVGAKEAQSDVVGDLGSEMEHNLSSTGMMTPAIPLASLVNKIKINITKNTTNAPSNSCDATSSQLSSTTTSTSAAATTTYANYANGASSNSGGSGEATTQLDAKAFGATIPVLCSGSMAMAAAISNIPTIGSNGLGGSAGPSGGAAAVAADSVGGGSGSGCSLLGGVSTISVIGSYGSGNSSNAPADHTHSVMQQQTTLMPPAGPTTSGQQQQQLPQQPKRPPTPPITYELKPALKDVPLKKTAAVKCGIETSGLCSIM